MKESIGLRASKKRFDFHMAALYKPELELSCSKCHVQAECDHSKSLYCQHILQDVGLPDYLLLNAEDIACQSITHEAFFRDQLSLFKSLLNRKRGRPRSFDVENEDNLDGTDSILEEMEDIHQELEFSEILYGNFIAIDASQKDKKRVKAKETRRRQLIHIGQSILKFENLIASLRQKKEYRKKLEEDLQLIMNALSLL